MGRRTATAVAASLIAGGALVLVPATAQAETSEACTISDATLTWGVKESFRSYISGSIANGSWEATDGATYETPDFNWTGGTGSYDPETKTGSVSFTGGIHFTGHEGILNMNMANPTVQINDGVAMLALDMKSNDVDGSVSVDEKQIPAINIEGDVSGEDELTLDAAPSTLSEEGAPAFGDFYEAGEAADPVTFAAPLHCPAAVAEEPAEEEPPADEAPAASDEEVADTGNTGWIIAAVAAGVLVVAGAITAVVRRKKKAGPAQPEDETPTE